MQNRSVNIPPSIKVAWNSFATHLATIKTFSLRSRTKVIRVHSDWSLKKWAFQGNHNWYAGTWGNPVRQLFVSIPSNLSYIFLNLRILFSELDVVIEWISLYHIQPFRNHDSVELTLYRKSKPQIKFYWINHNNITSDKFSMGSELLC